MGVELLKTPNELEAVKILNKSTKYYCNIFKVKNNHLLFGQKAIKGKA